VASRSAEGLGFAAAVRDVIGQRAERHQQRRALCAHHARQGETFVDHQE
jgi:hypothetical protein